MIFDCLEGDGEGAFGRVWVVDSKHMAISCVMEAFMGAAIYTFLFFLLEDLGCESYRAN